ncbi:hypothetical protein Mgra_00001318 [Meloidogyne graminicola]|uniref:Uncharacterized protein n=1 Tax=Meloidogyne graminicola TaxID=189291 RepID=A0A8T0A199_9BILA|nr:hypothetical protein Mgra_00001318 [Meloidogyne graminicola]
MKPKQGTTCAKKNAIMQLSSSGLKIKKRTNKSKFIREILNNESLKKKEQKQMMEYSPEKTSKFKINTTCITDLIKSSLSAGKNENDKIESSSSEEKQKGTD